VKVFSLRPGETAPTANRVVTSLPILSLEGTSRAAEWEPEEVVVFFGEEIGPDDDEHEPDEPPIKWLEIPGADNEFGVVWSPYKGLCLGTRGVAALGQLIEPYGEFLPLTCRQGTLVLFSPLVTVPEDIEHSVTTSTYYGFPPSMEQVMRPAFFSASDIVAPIFRIERRASWKALVTQEVVDRTRAAGIREVDFPLVWTDEPGVEIEPLVRGLLH
jgi:hypothetical protein